MVHFIPYFKGIIFPRNYEKKFKLNYFTDNIFKTFLKYGIKFILFYTLHFH